MKNLKIHEKWMTRALQLARLGAGAVHPNPMVGCVIVRGGKLLAEGYHHAYGKDHAEVDALKKIGAKARGATLYVNLEPCAHWGKTPPCMIAVVGAGIATVVAAMRDPNPKVAGKGFAYLKQHGVAVSSPVLQAEAQQLNRAFVIRIKEERPYVTLKAAVSLDGKIAAASGESQWITGPEARSRGHRLRAEVDAVAVGIHTILTDNPSLTAHGKGRNPTRVIFDSTLRIPLTAHVLNQAATTLILTTSHGPGAKMVTLERKGIQVYEVASDSRGQVSLPHAVRVLAALGITHMLVEGGGRLNAGFLEAQLVDEVLWFIAPKLLGGEKSKTAVEGRGVSSLAKAWNLKDVTFEQVGNDLCVRGRLQ